MERIEKEEGKRVVRNIKRLLSITALLVFLVFAVGCAAKESTEPKESENGASESASATDLTEDTGNPASESPFPDDSAAGGIAASLHLTPEEFPRVDGVALTAPFSEAVAATILRLPLEEARLYVLHSKAQEAYANLINGRADIIFATPPTEAELAYAKEQETELRLMPVLRSALTFFVNANNPVEDVRADEIVGIYSGEIKNWKDLGGADAEIRAYRRPESTSSEAGMLELVMREKPLAPVAPEMVYAEPRDIVNAVASFEHAEFAIGYSYYRPSMDAQSNGRIKYLRIGGVAPDERNITDGVYPFVSTIYMALRQEEPADSAASRLAEWILSEEGRAVAEKEGYTPMK
ncbi:MAG: substrate-binding domain-containing protein [Clostridiales Family XIII bacterium]|jgi:phosphate transport system substrate-binding protein|nr:substrate-binding domain-containing protein [Clostridiales Family XIII bacterium]